MSYNRYFNHVAAVKESKQTKYNHKADDVDELQSPPLIKSELHDIEDQDDYMPKSMPLKRKTFSTYSIEEQQSKKCSISKLYDENDEEVDHTSEALDVSRKSDDKTVPLEIFLATKEKLKETSNQLEKLKYENEIIKKYLKPELLEKLKRISVEILSVTANEDELIENLKIGQNGEYILSARYPKVKVEKILKDAIDQRLRCKTNSDDKCFRFLIQSLITSKEDWINGNSNKMKSKYNEEIQASYDYVRSKRIDFKYERAMFLIGQICCETRSKYKHIQKF